MTQFPNSSKPISNFVAPKIQPLRLGAAVGPKQPNHRADVLLVQKLLNNLIVDLDLGPLQTIPESGMYDAVTGKTIQAAEDRYFNGMADPLHRILPDSDLFNFMLDVQDGMAYLPLQPHNLSREMYDLAAKMVPLGADRLVHASILVQGSIRTYLPDILQALSDKQLNDEDMLLMALATIRAESSGFKPIDEKRSKYNTSPKGTPKRHDFDLYDNKKKQLGNLGSPDGASFKGRGFVQLTGRVNYLHIGKQLGLGNLLIKHPEKANDPKIAADVLAQFLKNHEHAIRSALKKGNLAHARRLVNGGSHGLAEFSKAFNIGRKFLHLAVIKHARKKIKSTQHKQHKASVHHQPAGAHP